MMSVNIPATVVCYAGALGSEQPKRIYLAEEPVTVVEVTDRWYEGGVDPTRPVRDYFRVRTGHGTEMLLRHDRAVDEWSLEVEG